MYIEYIESFRSTRGVTLAEDVYHPSKETTDTERCLIIAYVSKYIFTRLNWTNYKCSQRDNFKAKM